MMIAKIFSGYVILSLKQRGSLLALALMSLVASGCGREVDTLTAIGFDRPRPDQFLTAQVKPLDLPPDFHLMPPREQDVDDLPSNTLVPSSVMRAALLDAFLQLDNNLTKVRFSSGGSSVVDQPLSTQDLTPTMVLFLQQMNVTGTSAHIRQSVDRLTTGLTTETPVTVKRLSGRDPETTLIE